jgi:hypothetical protein
MTARDAVAMDSKAVSEGVAAQGNLDFYWRTFKTDPAKILIALWDSVREIALWVFRPRFPTGLGPAERLRLLWRFVGAELRIPGFTTVLETLWLAYAAARSPDRAETWVLVGCFKGLSAVRLSLLAEAFGAHLRVYDTFDGLPGGGGVYRSVDNGVDYEFKAGSYRGSEEELRRNLRAHGVPGIVAITAGDVSRTLPDPSIKTLGFAFLDVDLAESYESCFRGLSPHIGPRTVIAIHEACYAPIRSLIENRGFWESAGLPCPEIEYVAERRRIRSCRNLAILTWGAPRPGTPAGAPAARKPPTHDRRE